MAASTKSYASSDRMSAFWESEKSSPCIIPRVLLIHIDRMCVYASNGDDGPVYLAIRMQASSKRTLRSQQITVPERGQVFEHPITVEIQYPHAIKRDNPLLILLQRRKKYRNLGFKTLGLAQVNLSDVLQCRLRQHQLDLLPELAKAADQSSASGGLFVRPPQPIGFLRVARLETLPPPREFLAGGVGGAGGGAAAAATAAAASRKEFASGGGAPDDDDVSDEEETDPADDEEEEEKMKKDTVTKPKEWRQKFKLFMDENFSTILKSKKMKSGQQFELDYQPDLQNESLWNDLDDAEPDSDSSLDGGDELSVQSTPKPSLRRYFGSQASDCGQPPATQQPASNALQQQQNLLHPKAPGSLLDQHHHHHHHHHHHYRDPDECEPGEEPSPSIQPQPPPQAPMQPQMPPQPPQQTQAQQLQHSRSSHAPHLTDSSNPITDF